MIEDAATQQESDDDDDYSDRTVQRVSVANNAPWGQAYWGSLYPLFLEINTEVGEPPQGPVF